MDVINKKDGVTLIEVMIVCAMTLLAVTLFIGNLNRNSKNIGESEVQFEKMRVMKFIQDTRENAVKAGKDIEIVPDVMKNRFLLMCDGKIIKIMELNRRLKLIAVNKRETGFNLLSASKTGYMTPCTMIFKGEDKKEYFISVQVGKYYVQTKE